MASEKHYRFYRVIATNEDVLTAVINVNMVARKLRKLNKTRPLTHTQEEVTRVYACVVDLVLGKKNFEYCTGAGLES